MSEKKLIGYHGTDEKNLKSIMTEGFEFKENPKHWLGNGIYFFLDYSLAKWWSTSPSSKFGSSGINKNPVVVRAEILSDSENIMDTRILEDYKELLEMYEEFYAEFCKGTASEPINYNQLRCTFFDWVHSRYDVDIFIAGFEKDRTKKYGKETKDIKCGFKIPYVEYQMCVFNGDLIVKKERVNYD